MKGAYLRWLCCVLVCGLLLTASCGGGGSAGNPNPPPPSTFQLTAQSANPAAGVAFSVTPADNSGKQNGNSPLALVYNSGVQVTVTAPVTSGTNNFSSWTGCDSSAARACTVSVTGNRTVTANFNTPAPTTNRLSINSANPAAGVTMNANPPDNSNTSSGSTPLTLTYNTGTQVTVTAASTGGGNNFSSWTGCDSANGAVCTVAVNADRTVTANYAAPPPTTRQLMVNSVNPASGVTVSVSPNDNNNSSSGATPATFVYNVNTSVTVTAPATAAGNTFSNWTGCTSSIATSCTVNLSANTTVTATYSTPAPNAPTVTLQPAQTFQTWEAWRATFIGIYFLVNGNPSTPISQSMLSNILNDLANDLRLNGARIEQQAAQKIETTNDDADPNNIVWASFDFPSTYQIAPNEPTLDQVRMINDVIIPLRTLVQARQEPFFTYVDPFYKNATLPAHRHNAAEYAEFAQAFVTWLRNGSPSGALLSQPITPDYWVIYNEPDLNGFSDAEIAANIVAVGQRFQAMGIATKIETTESVSPDPARLNNVLATPGVSQFVRIVSFHGYDYTGTQMPVSFSARNQIRTAARGISARTAMSEICCHSPWNTPYNRALGFARDIYWNMTEADVSIWEPLSAFFTCASKGCPSFDDSIINLDSDLSDYFKNAHYYALRQYARFIRPNFVRVDASCTNCGTDPNTGQNVKPVVFRSPAGKYVVVIVNDQATAQDIVLSSFPAGTYDITGIDPNNATSPVTFPAQTIVAGQNVLLNFPARAIVTFAQR